MTVTIDVLKTVATRWIQEIWRPGTMVTFDELHSPDFKDHSAADRPANREGFQAGVKELFAAFPDFYVVVDDLIIDTTTGKVAVRWSARGVHRGTFMNIAPTGKDILFQGIEIIRIEHGCIVERWGEWDGVALLQQLRAE